MLDQVRCWLGRHPWVYDRHQITYGTNRHCPRCGWWERLVPRGHGFYWKHEGAW